MASLKETLRTITGLESDDENEFLGFTDEDLNTNEVVSSESEYSRSVSSASSDSDTDFSRDLLDDDSDTSEAPSSSFDFLSAYDDGWLKKFTENVGPLIHTPDSAENEIFSYFFSSEVWDLLVKETNRYAKDYLETANLLPNARATQWEEQTINDLKAFVALIILQGIVKMANYELYWTSKFLIKCPGIQSIMPRNKFELILQFLHLNNNTTAFPPEHPNHDRLHKSQPLFVHLVDRWKSAYHPSREISIDESIVAFKGRSPMKVYKPNKPHKWGAKCLGSG
jgi:hypothetical protein